MSAWARSWAYEQCVGAWVNGKWRKSPGAKAVLAAICEFPDQAGRCWVGQNTLAQMCDMSERTVRTHLAFLENTAKLIKRAPRRREDGTRTSDYIWVLAPAERLRPPDQPAKSAGSEEPTGKSRQINRQISPDQPAKSAGYPLVKEEPLVEPLEEERAREHPVETSEPLPDDVTSRCLLLLKKVKGIGKNYGELAVLLAELREEYPFVDPEKISKDYELYHRNPPKPTKNHLLKLRRFFENAERWRDKTVPLVSAPSNGDASADRQKDYEWLFN